MHVLVLILALVVACASQPRASAVEGIVLGEPFQLRVGERRSVEGEELSLELVAVVGDSRCPRDVTCIWEGDAEIELRLERGDGEQAKVRLHTHGDPRFPREASALGHRLRLEALDPYPQTSGRIPQEDYVATLVLT